MLLHIYIGDLEMCAWFGTVHELPVNILVGTSFMNRYLWRFFSCFCNLTLLELKPV